jgi:hypothetical protein
VSEITMDINCSTRSTKTEISTKIVGSLEFAVVRAGEIPEEQEGVSSSEEMPTTESRPTKRTHGFVFADSTCNAKPAVEYVGDFIDLCESFISDAEAKFP